MTETKSSSEEQTISFAQELAAGLKARSVLGLVGDLGAGKTHFVKGLARGLGSEAPVSSPTFTIVHEYGEGSCPLYHFDFYRVEDAGEILAIGWEEYLDEQAVIVVEWADRFPELMPAGTQWWKLDIVEQETRNIVQLDESPDRAGQGE